MRVFARSLLLADDVRAAIAWRLAGMPEAEVLALSDALRPLAGDFREDNPRVSALLADLHRPGDRRGPWTLACAVLSEDAMRRGDANLFWSAGIEVVQAMRQGRRGSHPKPRSSTVPDALDALLQDYLERGNPATVDAVLRHCESIASGLSPVVADVDSDRRIVVCTLTPRSKKLTDVSEHELSKRLRRAKKAA